MTEHQPPTAPDPDQGTTTGSDPSASPAEPEEALGPDAAHGQSDPEPPGEPLDRPDPSVQAADDAIPEPEEGAGIAPAGAGKRVTHRTVRRRTVKERTEETITEDLPLVIYEGPTSDHPAPVG